MMKLVGTRVAILLVSAVLALGAPVAAAQGGYLLETYNVELLGQIGGSIHAVVVQGSIAYIGDSHRLVIVDVSTPAHPVWLGQTTTLPETVFDVAVVGNTAYLADGCGGLRIVDVSDPTAPREVGDIPGYASGVALVGSTAYIAAGSGLRIVDVSDPTAPREVGNFDTPAECPFGVAVVGSTAYVTTGSEDHGGGLYIVDVSDPTTPTELGAWHMSWHPYEIVFDVAVVGSTAYITTWRGGHGGNLIIIDVSDPAAPRELGSFPRRSLSQPKAVAVVGSTAYIACAYQTFESSSLVIVDVSDPTTPTKLGVYDTPGWPSDVAVVGSVAYVADGPGGLLILRYVAPEPTITPTPSIWRQEAELGTIVAPLAVEPGMGASACAYVYSQATAYAEPGVGSLSFDIQVSTSGEYYVWTRAMGLGWNNKSFFVSIDGGEPVVDSIPQIDGQWDWVWQQFDGGPIALEAGMHTLCFAGREAGARLDYVVLTNDPAFVPPDLPICSAGLWLPLVIKSH